MEKSDSYYTIKSGSEGTFKDKGSKFFAFTFPIYEEEEVKKIMSGIKKKFYDARHWCYAYKIGANNNRYRINDDGEPSGTAGKPIFGQIESNSLSDILIVVVRYFGGTLLGTSGLINAYRSAAANAIKNSTIIEHVITCKICLAFKYELLSTVLRIAKEENITEIMQDFTDSCKLILDVRLSDYEKVLNRYKDVYGVEILDI